MNTGPHFDIRAFFDFSAGCDFFFGCIAAWLKDYNESRPHRALNNLAPLEYVAQLENGA